jgi:hypothetical protein
MSDRKQYTIHLGRRVNDEIILKMPVDVAIEIAQTLLNRIDLAICERGAPRKMSASCSRPPSKTG